MATEREMETGAAVAIALAVIPMSWVAYWALSIALMVLGARIVWLSVRPRAARLAASVAAVVLLSLILVPEMIVRLGQGM